jgi:broad specificity phosphatase PhoE
MFKATVRILAVRHARTCFVHIDSNSTNESKNQATALARTAVKLRVPRDSAIFSASEVTFPLSTRPVIVLNGKHKVYTDLPEVSPRPRKWQTGDDEDDDADRNSNHRSRAKVHALKAGLRKELLACKDHKEFWDFVRQRTDPWPKKAKVSLQDLSDDFEVWLNYPAVAPPSFNIDQLTFNKRMADELG